MKNFALNMYHLENGFSHCCVDIGILGREHLHPWAMSIGRTDSSLVRRLD